jgi:hypothetical protein
MAQSSACAISWFLELALAPIRSAEEQQLEAGLAAWEARQRARAQAR